MGCTYVHTDSESITEYVKARNRVISLVVGYLLTLLISAYLRRALESQYVLFCLNVIWSSYFPLLPSLLVIIAQTEQTKSENHFE